MPNYGELAENQNRMLQDRVTHTEIQSIRKAWYLRFTFPNQAAITRGNLKMSTVRLSLPVLCHKPQKMYI